MEKCGNVEMWKWGNGNGIMGEMCWVTINIQRFYAETPNLGVWRQPGKQLAMGSLAWQAGWQRAMEGGGKQEAVGSWQDLNPGFDASNRRLNGKD